MVTEDARRPDPTRISGRGLLGALMNVGLDLAQAGEYPELVYANIKPFLYVAGGAEKTIGKQIEPHDYLFDAAWRTSAHAPRADEVPTLDWMVENYHERLMRAADLWVRSTLPAEPTALYRWFDVDAKLIYVGITGQLAARQDAHGKGSTWTQFASTCQVDTFRTRGVAEIHERWAIKAGRPLFNRQHNDTPEARARLVAYLIEHGRTDLLVPAVSRG